MTDEMLAKLAPEVVSAVERYLDSVAAAMRAAHEDEVDSTLETLREHFAETLDATSTVGDAETVIRQLGAPGAFTDGSALDEGRSRLAGTVLGMPYDMRVPSASRVASRWWNPRDPHLLVPRVFGIGWDLNFGAVAVKLGLIEPDAEDEPFGAVSQREFALALAVPVALAAAIGVTFVALASRLPAALPAHWSINGAADEFWPRSRAFGYLFVFASLPCIPAVWAVASRRSTLSRGAWIGFASLFAGLAGSIWAMTLATVFGVQGWWMPPLSIVCALLVPLAVMTWLARRGRAAEMHRDLKGRGVR